MVACLPTRSPGNNLVICVPELVVEPSAPAHTPFGLVVAIVACRVINGRLTPAGLRKCPGGECASAVVLLDL